MDVAVKTKFVSRLDDLLRDFRIPLGNFTDEIKTDFRIPKFFENGIDSLLCETSVQIARRVEFSRSVSYRRKSANHGS